MTRFLALLISLTMMAAACGDDNPSAPSGSTTTPTTFSVPLSAANEIPPITNAEAGTTGTATIVLRITRDSSGTATAASANFQIDVSGFPSGSTITLAHIHTGAAGSSGAILVNTGLSAGELVLTNGAGSIAKNDVNLVPDQAVAVVNNPTGYYFNVHTAMNPAGVLRGQLAGGGAVVTPGDPEPGPY